MDMENTLAKEIYSAGEQKALYDAACKRLLSEKEILAWIMKSCLEEYRDCGVKEIAERYIEGTPQVGEEPVHPDEVPRIHGMSNEDSTIREGTVVYDVRFTAMAPSTGEPIRLIINLEAQNSYYPGYPIVTRALYYCCRLISSQYGREFTHGRYLSIGASDAADEGGARTTACPLSPASLTVLTVTVVVLIVFHLSV